MISSIHNGAVFESGKPKVIKDYNKMNELFN